MYPVKVPFFWKWFFPRQVWHRPRGKKTIYLTFDDGPIPLVTPWVLKTLQDFEAKATFFCIGDNVRSYPQIYQQILDQQHRTGNHTFNHLKGSRTDDEAYLKNVALCRQYVDSELFRPPYGRIKRSQVRKLSQPLAVSHQPLATNPYQIIMWDVLSGDFDENLSPEKCLQNVLANTESGSIVVFHDSVKAFPRLEYVLPRALEMWCKKGFGFEKL